jgi:hypothetical protein
VEWYWWVLLAVGLNWGLPLLTWVYPLVMWLIFRDLKFEGFRGPFFRFRLLGDKRVYWKGDWVAPEGEYVIVGKSEGTYQISSGKHTLSVPEDDDRLDFMEPWHAKLWVDWGGVGLYWFMVYRDRPSAWDDYWVGRTITHESVHCTQVAILGMLHVLSYIIHVLFIYFFQSDRHPYLDCWAERQARRIAGQKVDIPKDEWPQGPDDRWPWW